MAAGGFEVYEVDYNEIIAEQMPYEDIDFLHGLGFGVHEVVGRGEYGVIYRGTCTANACKLIEISEEEATEEDRYVEELGKYIREVSIEGQLCAIKWVPTDNANFDEWKHLRYLKHPNIVEIFNIFETEAKDVYIILEFMESGDLFRFTNTQPIDKNMCRDFINQLAEGLAYLHNKGLIHGDIHCGNVMLTNKSGETVLKFIDFGKSLQIESHSEVRDDPQRFAEDIGDLGKIFDVLVDRSEFDIDYDKESLLEVIDKMIEKNVYKSMDEVINDLQSVSESGF